jgi:hypothetical protein
LRRLSLLPAAALLAVAGAATPAYADLTAFVGGQTNPSTRMTRGVSGGSGFLILGFEGEYAQAGGDDQCPAVAVGGAECAPSVRTVMFNGLVQTPRGVVPKVQLYATAGGGYYRIRFESLDQQETGFGTNVGGGVKIELAGPLRLRLDYRIFRLSNAFQSRGVEATSQRLYAGANVAF